MDCFKGVFVLLSNLSNTYSCSFTRRF